MPKRSAGILMYRQPHAGIELLLVHPGGPFWAKKDWGAWSIPKGEYAEDEDPLTVAKREFEEETGARPEGDFLALGDIVQAGRKIVTAWAVEGDFDPATLKSNEFELEWPPTQRAQGVVSGGRPRGMVLARRGPPENSPGTERVHRQAADGNRKISRSSQRPTAHIVPSRRRSAVGFSTKMRAAMRAASPTCAARRSAMASARRERQGASGPWGTGQAREHEHVLMLAEPIAQPLRFPAPHP